MRMLARALLVLLLASPLGAWELVSTPQLFADSDVVVIGKLSAVKHDQRGPAATDQGYVQAYEVLKGALPDGHGATIAFPGQRGVVQPDGTFRSTLTAQDLRYEEGLEACWFLKRDPASGGFVANHPARVQPYPFYDEIRKLAYGTAARR